MPRERDPKRAEAEKMWLDSGGQLDLVDIAAQLIVSAGTIRGWKSKDNWSGQLNGTFRTDEGNAPNKPERSKRKTGAPKGNKNAVGNRGGAPPGSKNALGNKGGHGGPFGNKKAVKTGEHESILLDALDDDERILFDVIRTDPLEQINNDIRICELRIRRMLLRLQRVQSGEESKSTDRKFQRVEGADGKPSSMQEVERTEKQRTKLERELAIEDALTRVQDKKTKLLELKHKFLVDETPPEETEDDGFMDALKGMTSEVWADAGDSSQT